MQLCFGRHRAGARSTPCTALRSATVSRGWAAVFPAIQPLQHSSARRGLPGHTTQTFSTAIGTDSPDHISVEEQDGDRLCMAT